MNTMRALGVNWNALDPFPTYGPMDYPVFAPVVPPVVAPAPVYNYPVLTEAAPEPATAPVPSWLLVGGAILAGVALVTLLRKKS